MKRLPRLCYVGAISIFLLVGMLWMYGVANEVRMRYTVGSTMWRWQTMRHGIRLEVYRGWPIPQPWELQAFATGMSTHDELLLYYSPSLGDWSKSWGWGGLYWVHGARRMSNVTNGQLISSRAVPSVGKAFVPPPPMGYVLLDVAYYDLMAPGVLLRAIGGWVDWRHRRRIRHRRAAGLCVVCGYDLRGSPACCPECGQVNTPQVSGV